jgi:DNA-binding NarL/FixJ family response regulator
VDDFEPFRAFVCSTLQQNAELEVVCELSDGLAAVQKAEELGPDLIMLDIGLPTLNGIDAARQIRKLVPNAKIIFLSQESSDDVVREALSTGAQGYVAKIQAGRDLLASVEAVLGGKRFVSAGLTGHEPADAASTSHPADLRSPDMHSGLGETKVSHRHEVQFYSDDEFILKRFSHFVAGALGAGKSAIVLATEPQRVALAEKLQTNGVDVAAAVAEGRYVSLDVAEALSTFMVDGKPDTARFFKCVESAVGEAAKAAKCDPPRVVACGECAPFLLARGKADAAILVEQLTNDLIKRYDLEVLCGYPLTSFPDEDDTNVFRRICAEHSVVYQDERTN